MNMTAVAERQARRLLAVFAHPDDETLGVGGTLAKYADAGVEVHLLTATRGEMGWGGDEEAYPGPQAFGQLREQELRAAVNVLGLAGVTFLDYIDGEVDKADAFEVASRIAHHIRRIRPQVVVTFGQDGIYGHPDHIAITQHVTAALTLAAAASHADGLPPHVVDKLYYTAPAKSSMDFYEQAMGELVMNVDGVERRSPGWPEWSITTRIDADAYWERVWEAAQCHRSQLPAYESLLKFTPEQHRRLWGTQEFYRVFSLVNGGRAPESDLFEGVKARVEHRSGAIAAQTARRGRS
jgi:LmbE family N-acetylglucosaminyl deacetylase